MPRCTDCSSAVSRAAEHAVERATAAVAARDREVHAWAFVDPASARADAIAVEDGALLDGVVLGVKDVFDTASMPTEYGSPIYAGHQPRGDAAAVALLRAAGAVMLGKTVTAELAGFTPGPTRNPRRLTCTPGGSSSGSAAAVASGMADLTIGTQTAGSITRPASFCGVFGFKPTFGSVSVAGLKLLAPSLDTVGWFAESAGVLDRARVALTGRPPSSPLDTPPAIALVRTDIWPSAEADSQAAVLRAGERAHDAGAAVVERELPVAAQGLAMRQPIVQAFESARSLAWERNSNAALLSDGMRALLDWGASIDPAEYDEVRAERRVARGDVGAFFGDSDVILTPAVVGEAPGGTESTGDPRFARLWTLLGFPSLSVPALEGHTGLPIGVQLVGRPGDDALVLAAGAWLADVLAAAR